MNKMKEFKSYINESAKTEYRVSLIDCKGKEDLPITVSILVDSADVKAFEDYLTQEQDNLFAHAEGGNIEY